MSQFEYPKQFFSSIFLSGIKCYDKKKLVKIYHPHKVIWCISILFLTLFLKAQKIYNIGVGHLDSTISFNQYIQIYFTSESPYGTALSIPLIFLLNVLIWAHLLSICCFFFACNHSIPKVISVLMSFEIPPPPFSLSISQNALPLCLFTGSITVGLGIYVSVLELRYIWVLILTYAILPWFVSISWSIFIHLNSTK